MWMYFLSIILTLLINNGTGMFSGEVNVIDLTEHDFDYIVGRGHEVWALFFYIPDNKYSESAAPAFKEAAKRMLGLAKFGSINVDKYPVLAHRFDIRKIPSLIVIDKHLDETKYVGKMTDTAIMDFIGGLLLRKVQYGKERRLSDNKLVKELTEEEMIANKGSTKYWLIAFYDSKHNLTRVDFVQMIEYAAENLEGTINVGAFDVSKRTTPLNYEEIPTVVLYHGKKLRRREVEYNDTFYGNKLVDFVLARATPPPVKELWTENILTDLCQKKRYCMLTFIPVYEKCDRECKLEIKSMLEEVVENFKTIGAGWVVIRQGVMKRAEKMLDINETASFPVFIAVEVKTLRSEYLTEKFNAENIKKMISDVLSEGFTGRTIPLFDHLPEYRPWKRDEL